MRNVFSRLRSKAAAVPRPLLLLAFGALALAAVGCRGAQPDGWSGPVANEGVLYIGDTKGNLLAFDKEDGTQQWGAELRSPPRGSFGCTGAILTSTALYGNAAISGDLVYATSYGGKVYAFSASSGAERWVFPQDRFLQPVVSGPAIANGALFFGDNDGIVYALDAATGVLKWSFPTGGKVWATPVVEDGRVYVGSLDGRVYALDADTGTETWRSEKMGGIQGTPVLTADTLYVGSLDRNVYALNRASGTEKWHASSEGWFWGGPVVSGTLIIAADTGGNVIGLDAATGNKVWTYDVQAEVSSTPAIAGEMVVIGSADGRLAVLEAATGKLSRSITAGTSVQGPLLGQGNKVYVRAEDAQGLYVRGYDLSTGGQLLSAPLEKAASAQTPVGTSGQGAGIPSWTYLIIGGLIAVLLMMLLRMRKPG